MGLFGYFLWGLFWCAAAWVIGIAVWAYFGIKTEEWPQGDDFTTMAWLLFIGGLVVGVLWPVALFIVFWAIICVPIFLVLRARLKKAKAESEAVAEA